jgi:hypothetical protein
LVHRSELSSGKWLGIPVYRSLTADDWYLIQLRGAAHIFGPTGTDQDDYAQLGLIAHARMWVDGVGEIATSRAYTEPELCWLVTHDGRPFDCARHPNVPLIIQPDEPEPQPELDEPPEWLNPELTHGERSVEWMLAQLEAGVAEQPMGSNNGPEISQYLGLCERDGKPGFGSWLAKVGGNWCAAAASAADVFTRLYDDPEPPYKPRCSGIELQNDAIAAGAWRPAEHAASGKFQLERGDIMIMHRGSPGSWRRHVARFVRWLDRDAGTIETIGGNEGNRFMLTKRNVNDCLGYIEMPSPVRPKVMIELPEMVIIACQCQCHEAYGEDIWTDGNNVLGGEMMPEDYGSNYAASGSSI